MKYVILAVALALTVPAYADETLIDNDKALTAIHDLGECMRKVTVKGRPLSDEDKQTFREALDTFHKEMTDYYELSQPPKVTTKSGIKSIGKGLYKGLQVAHAALHSGNGYSSLPNLGPPTMGSVLVPATGASMGGYYPYTNMGGMTTFTNGFPH